MSMKTSSMSMKWKTWAPVLLILACSGVASAGSISMKFVGDTPAQTCRIDPAPSPYNTSTRFYIGRSNFTVNLTQDVGGDSGASALLAEASKNLTAPQSSIGKLSGYCIDTYQAIGSPWPDVWEVVNLNINPTGAPTLSPANAAKSAAAKVADLQGLFARHGLTATPTADEAAAMGAAVWEIVNETSSTYSLSAGTFKVYQASGAWASKASGWLADLSMPANTPTPILYALVDPFTQDFVIAIAGVGNTNHAPEPFTMLTASLALGGLGVYIRKRSGRSRLAN